MKKIFIVLLGMLLVPLTVQSQQTLNEQLRELFIPLRRSVNPAPHAKFLYDMSVKLSDEIFYTPLSYNMSSTNNWFQMYSEMSNCSYTQFLIPDEMVVYDAARAEFSLSNKIPLGVFDFEFNKFRDDVFDSLNNGVYFAWDDDNIWDPSGTPPSPYEVNTNRTPPDDLFGIFAAAPLIESYYFRDVTFVIDPSRFVFYDPAYNRTTLSHPSPHTFQVDFGDGNGWVTIDPFSYGEYNVIYSGKGEKTIKVRVITDGSVVIKHSMSSILIETDNEKVLPDIDITTVAGLNVGVYLACGHTEITKPLVYLEGIDLFENRKIPQIYNDMIADENLNMLKNEGYDIIVVDWGNSTIDMRLNAMYVVALIEYLKCEVNNDNEFVVVGESMGGVVARYALTYMETSNYISNLTQGVNTCKPPNQSHNTRLLITIDSPHQGAYVPLAMQFLGDGLTFAAANAIYSPFIFRLLAATTGAFSNIILNRPAVKQLLIVNKNSINAGEYIAHEDRDEFMTELIGMNTTTGGYPQFCKKVAVSNGSMDGMLQRDFFDSTAAQEGASYLNMSYLSDVKVFRRYSVFPILDMPDFRLNALSTTSGDTVIHIEIVHHYFSLKGCLRKIFGFGFLPSGGCGHSTSSSTFTRTTNNPVAWDIMPGGNMSALIEDLYAQRNRHINLWVFFQFHFDVVAPGTLVLQISRGGLLAGTHINITASSELPRFCFIPLQSGLDYSGVANQDHDVLSDGVTLINARTSADAVVGRGVNSGHLQFASGAALPTPNDTLYPRPWVNGEIGDYQIWLDNRTVNRRAHFEGRQSLVAGSEVGQIYEYPNSIFFEIPTSASKDFGFVVSADSGKVTFQSSQEIGLRPGFVAEAGSEFRAYIDDIPFCSLTKWEMDSVIPHAMVFPLGVENIEVTNSKHKIVVYPNPSTGSVSIVFPQAGTYYLFNSLGAVLHTFVTEALQAEITTMELHASGLYFLVADSPDISPFKFIITQ